MSKRSTKSIGSLLSPFAFLLLTLAGTAAAQTATATLSGVVEDQNSAVIAGATVRVQNRATSFERNAVTNESGQFTVPLLPPGTYAVTVRRDGFTQVEVSNVILNVGDQKSVRIVLKVGDVNAAIEVTAEAPLIDESPAVGTTVDRQFVANMPLNGRSFQSLISLTPGVVPTHAQAGSPGQFSVNGQRANANYFTVDGVSANAAVTPSINISQTPGGTTPAFSALGGTNNLVSIDALQEFKVQTSTYAPEFGRTPGGQVTIVTRSGTNDFHGTVFDYFRNEKLDANNWFSNRSGAKRSQLRQNDFGGVIGGPVILPGYHGRNKTFFFFSYEGLRLRQPQFVPNAEVPSINLRQTSVAAIQPYLKAFPIPNGVDEGNGLAFFSGGFSNPGTLDATSVRIDQNIGQKFTIFGRYNHSPSNFTTRGADTLSSPFTTLLNTDFLTLGSTFTLSPTTTNDLRLNYTHNRGATFFGSDNFGGATPLTPAPVLPSFASQQDSLFGFLFLFGNTNFFLGNNARNTQQQFNLVDTLTSVVGNHQLKFGADYRRLAPRLMTSTYALEAGFFSADAIRAGNADLLLVVNAKPGLPIYKNFSAFAQDTWKVSSRLTLTYGLRWDVNPAPTSADGNDPLTATGIDNPATATIALQGTRLYKTTYGNFAPRFGISYLLRDKPGRETILRGGVGVFYDLGSGQASQGLSSLPFRNSVLKFGSFPFPASGEIIQPPPLTITPPVSVIVAFDPNLKLPRTYEWNAALEQSLGAQQKVSASYVGAVGRKLITPEIFNNPSSAAISRLYVFRNKGTSDYHALQMQYQRRLSRGVQALVSYTWSHSIDTLSDEAFTGLDRASSDFDIRHNFSAATTWNLPAPKWGRFGEAVLSHWSLDGIVHLLSATPINIVARSNFNLAGQSLNQRPNLIPGVPIYVYGPQYPGGRAFNTAAPTAAQVAAAGCLAATSSTPAKGAFCTPPATSQGTLPRNAFRGFPLNQVDMSLSRQFNLTERFNALLRIDAFNIFNHPNFADPNNTMTSGTFGVSPSMYGAGLRTGSTAGFNPLYQLGGPRSIQLSLKVQF